MKDAIENANGREHAAPKARPLAWLFQEWVFQLVLVAAVIVALVDGAASLNGGSLV